MIINTDYIIEYTDPETKEKIRAKAIAMFLNNGNRESYPFFTIVNSDTAEVDHVPCSDCKVFNP